METPALKVLGRCENLRWKGLSVDDQTVQDNGEHIYWCLKTQIGLGPDGQIVGKYDCNPGRGCYCVL